LGTLLYSPGIKVYIETEKNGTIDVSDDLVDGTMVRRSDGVSTFNFSLQNARRKYDGVFMPNDRIVVSMRRITWMRVYTGYLNGVPLLTAWPRVVPVSSSCSLKRIQYWYWDAGLPASQVMVANAMQAVKTAEDGGMANAILTIMKEVVGWPPEKIHIAGIPKDWFDFAYKVAQDIDARAEEADKIAQQFYSALQGTGLLGGGTVANGAGSPVSNGTMKTGNYGGEDITKIMLPYIEGIYNIGKQLGATDRDLIIGMMTAMQESSMGSDVKAMTVPNQYYCVGLFQQTIKGMRPGWGPNEGWGTKAELLDYKIQCKNFFNRLLKVKNRTSMSLAQAAETIQISGEGWRFAKHEAMGRAVVNFLNNASTKSAPVTQGTDPNWKGGSGSFKPGAVTGQALVDLGVRLFTQNTSVDYRLGGDDPPNTPLMKVRLLDCSSFIQWVYYQATGSLHGFPRSTGEQEAWLKVHGKRITSLEATKTAGAVMYHPGHVEMSMGTGTGVVGAHGRSSTPHVGPKNHGSQASLAAYLPNSYLLPGIQYSVGGGGTTTVPGVGDAGAASPGTVGAAPQIPIQTAAEQPWYNANDPYDKLFGNNPWVPQLNTQEEAYSSAFTGVRALLNDQPLLPYLKNLFNATMRSFCSAPNGDLIGWFPDYYGIWGTAASVIVEPIEIKDFNVEWSDDFFVTHQYTTAAASTNTVDTASGLASPANILNAAVTMGIATIDVPSILYALFGINTDKANAEKFINFIYKRFGARPDFQQLPGVVGNKGEFFSALFLFMRQWAYQYNADIPLTFMPELWPGMLIKIPAFNFQAYITTVTHSFSFGENGSFSTSVNIAAPARLPSSLTDRSHTLIGLPIAGGLIPTPPKKK
jgi:cell wall-associated NlpC family hydrolase